MSALKWDTGIVRGKYLLLTYAIVPVLYLVMLIDWVFFSGTLRTHLPTTPDSLLFYLLIFGFPHIFASFFSFADAEYVRHYKKHLLFFLPLCFLILTVGSFYVPRLVLLFIVIFTAYHTKMQQAGLLLFFTKKKPPYLSLGYGLLLFAPPFHMLSIFTQGYLEAIYPTPHSLVFL